MDASVGIGLIVFAFCILVILCVTDDDEFEDNYYHRF